MIQKRRYDKALVEIIPELREKRKLFYTEKASGMGAQRHRCRTVLDDEAERWTKATLGHACHAIGLDGALSCIKKGELEEFLERK